MVCIERTSRLSKRYDDCVSRRLTEAQIAELIRKGDWQGKAGPTASRETGDEFVERIEGTFTNVMGCHGTH